MSNERPIGDGPAGISGGPVGGVGPAGPLNPAAVAPLPQAQERDTTDVAGQRATVPDLAAPPPEAANRPQTAILSGRRMRVADILDTDEDGPTAQQATGMGPRLVVLHEFVRGKSRGNVVWASDILGLERFREASGDDRAKAQTAQVYIRSELKRLINLGAVREANEQEAQYEQVTFVETQEQAEAALAQTQARLGQVEEENERLRKLVQQMQEKHQGTDEVKF